VLHVAWHIHRLMRNLSCVQEKIDVPLRNARGATAPAALLAGDPQVTPEGSPAHETLTTEDGYKPCLGAHWCASAKWPSTRTVALALVILSLLVTAYSYIMKWMVWMREHERQGRIWFLAAYVACLLLLLPASVLALVAGMTPTFTVLCTMISIIYKLS
jgi:hypothetical protein